MTATAIPMRIRKAVLDRADGHCEKCGKVTDHLELHHRLYRSRLGKHEVSNIVALDGWGNVLGCHSWAHTTLEAEGKGFSIRSGFDPHAVKIELFGIGPCWLLDDGSVKQVGE